jgi:hypothetical protein
LRTITKYGLFRLAVHRLRIERAEIKEIGSMDYVEMIQYQLGTKIATLTTISGKAT